MPSPPWSRPKPPKRAAEVKAETARRAAAFSSAMAACEAGDAFYADCLDKMGAKVEYAPSSITVTGPPEGTKLKGVDVDCIKIPDAAMTLASVALVAEGTTTIRNVGSWRVKETERMKAIVAETSKFGADVTEQPTTCIIKPPTEIKPMCEIETSDDHRIAMTFALAACAGVPVKILDPGCTSKTFPTYFDALKEVCTE